MRVTGIVGRLLVSLLLVSSSAALDPSRMLTQYGHTAWRVRDGYFSSPPLAIAQTKDGQLWLGGEGGLLRFDGVQFSVWKAPAGQALPDQRIFGLLAASDGSLWIGTGSGLARWKDDKLAVYATAGRFSSLLEDHQGKIWAGHTRARDLVPPLCRFAGNEFKCSAFSDRPGMSWVGAIKEDHNGDLWIASDGAVCRRAQTGETTCYAVPASNRPQTTGGVQSLAVDSDGTVWVDGGVSGIWQLKSGQWKHYNEYPQLKLQLGSSLSDREGGLWLGSRSRGLIRRIGGRSELFDRTDGLSGEMVTALYEDREGSIWVATSAGFDRFRDVKIETLTTREGMPLSPVDSILASKHGGLWIGGGNELFLANIDDPLVYQKVRGLPDNTFLGATFEDSHGRLWLGVGQALAWREDGQFHTVPSLKLHQVGERVRAITEDRQGNIWATTTDPELALVHIHGGRVLETFTLRQLGGQISAIAPDPQAGIWLSRAGAPGLILAREGTFETKASDFPGFARDMFFDSHGLWAATRKGLIHYDNKDVSILSTKNGLPCDDLDVAILDDTGSMWLKGTCGLMQVPASELESWRNDPGRRVQFRYLDAFDGAQAGASAFGHVAKTSDGRLWFALEETGIQVVDPTRLQDNRIPPPVVVTRLVADHHPYALNSTLRLPPRSRDLEIDYTAFSLSVPERVLFRYKLEGVDKDWQDAGTRRQAFFTNLDPGHYQFRVIASNNDGVWNETGASLDFDIAPAFYQTGWFIALCALSTLVLLYLLYVLRLRQVENRFNVRLEERVGERTRIARDLHDTLLQSFQGVLLKLQAVGYMLPSRPDDARNSLDTIVEQARQAINEGRDAVQGLRSSTVVTNDLAEALRALGAGLSAEGNSNSPEFRVDVEGTPRDLAPILRDDVYRIAGEAVRNAFQHAQAARIEVEIHYEQRHLRLRVRDDGKGIASEVLEAGEKAGHFGLPGLQERAKLVDGKLTVRSSPDTGTEINLTIPGSVVYAFASARRTVFRKRGT